MSFDPRRTPVVVAVGQAVERDTPLAPVDLVERAARAALDEAPGIAGHVDQVSVVNIINGGGKAPATALARRLGIAPSRVETTTIGGNTPQWLVTRAAERIASGEPVTALIAGGETVHSQRVAPDVAAITDAEAADASDEVVGDDRPGLGPGELAAGLMAPAHVYPLFESVIAHRAGRSFAEHRRWLGSLMARLAEVAAEHPYAWFREQRTPASIAEPSDDNRLVAEPYTKRMNAFIAVDQAAALVVTSLQTARDVGAAGPAIFVHSGADASDVWFPAERPLLGSSPGIRAAGRAALRAADAEVDDMMAFDLYSCFPSAVEMTAEALGLDLDDPRGFTVTGGLPSFGGPGNNYTTHGIATMVEVLREEGGRGLVSGLGWFSTKHSIGVYGVAPPVRGFRRGDTEAAQRDIDASALPLVTEVGEPSRATVDASTVIYARDGGVQSVPVVATLAGGSRVVATVHRDEQEALAGVNLVGASVVVEGSPPRARVASPGGEAHPDGSGTGSQP